MFPNPLWWHTSLYCFVLPTNSHSCSSLRLLTVLWMQKGTCNNMRVWSRPKWKIVFSAQQVSRQPGIQLYYTAALKCYSSRTKHPKLQDKTYVNNFLLPNPAVFGRSCMLLGRSGMITADQRTLILAVILHPHPRNVTLPSCYKYIVTKGERWREKWHTPLLGWWGRHRLP